MNSPKPLATCRYRLVNIDPVTRKKSPISDRVYKRIAALVIDDGGEQLPNVDKPPSTTPRRSFSWSIQVRYDDMDIQFHTNVGSYLGFALECAAQACAAGFYALFEEDIALYRVKQTMGLHLGESTAGDDLIMTTWGDDDDKRRLHFTAKKATEELIYYVQIEYYDQIPDASL